MDPDVALATARQAASRIVSSRIVGDEFSEREAATELAEAFQALDEWLSRAGFPPRAWGPWYTVGPRGLAPPPS